jgi:prepilin-type N-terminal cleavage/methylation domain-containing protein
MNARLKSQDGFTLVELLCAMTIGTIVLLAAFSLMDSTTRGQKTVESRLDATERGRQAMEQLTRQLRSQVCIGKGIAPMLEATDAKLTFYASIAPYNAASPSAQPTVQKRTLEYVPNGTTGRGSLVETVIDATGAAPDFTWTATPRTRTLVRDVAPVTGVPFFRFYKYDPDLSPNVQLLTPPIADANRQIIVQVQTAFLAYANAGKNSDRISTRLENKITVRTADPTDPTRSPKCI